MRLKKLVLVFLCAVIYYNHIRKKKMDKTIINAISENPSLLKSMSMEVQGNQELILAAINGNAGVFEYVDERMQTNPDFITLAVKENPLVIDFFP